MDVEIKSVKKSYKN